MTYALFIPLCFNYFLKCYALEIDPLLYILFFFLMEEDQKSKFKGHFSVTFLRRSHQVFSCLVTYSSQVMHAVVYLNFMKATIIRP